MPNEKLIRGTIVQLGDKEYVVPPLLLGAVEALRPQIDSLAKPFGSEQIDAVLKVGLAAIRRNYPEMTREQLESVVDLSNMEELMAAATRTNRFPVDLEPTANS